MAFSGAFIDQQAVLADGAGLAAVALLRRDEVDAAVAVLVDLPLHERRSPLTGLLLAGKGLAVVVGPVFGRAEQGF